MPITHQPSGANSGEGPPASYSPPPGWYVNPDGSATIRYWDGSHWTSYTAPLPPPPLPPPPPATWSRRWRITAGLFMSVIIILAMTAASLPWRTVRESSYCERYESFNGALFLGLWAVLALITVGGIMVAKREKVKRGSWDSRVKAFGIVAIVVASIGTPVFAVLAPAISANSC